MTESLVTSRATCSTTEDNPTRRTLGARTGSRRRRIRTPRSRRRAGQALVEFAVVALALYLLIAAVLTFGHLLYVAQGGQQAVDVAAREISRTPLPADDRTLEQVLRGDANADSALVDVRRRTYDEHYLVLNLDTLHGRATLADLVADLPTVNQQLVPLMVFDQLQGVRVLRYPGAVFTDIDAGDDPVDPPPSGWLVAIPLIATRGGSGVETIDWVPPLEEIDSPANPDPFRITSAQRGVAALRLNYPFQAAAMTSFRPNPAGPFEPTIGAPNVADDGAVTVVDLDGFQPTGALVPSDFDYGPNSGEYGLGRQAALGSVELTGGLPVRPFRRVITSQAIYRRELFDE